MLLISIIIIGIMSLLTRNYEIENDYKRNNIVFILKNNASNILRKLDTSYSPEGDVFFIYRDPDALEYQVLYGTGNEIFKYINARWERVTNTGAYFTDPIYTRIFYTEKKDLGNGDEHQIIKWAIRELIRKSIEVE